MKLKNFLFAAILLFLTLPSFAQQLDNLHSSDVLLFSVNGVTFRMIPVEGGTFKMGATSEQNSLYEYEKPAHEVTLSSFSIGETEVTQELWEAVMGSNPSNFKGDNRPVKMVCWDECIDFINKLNEITEGKRPAGRKFRLPTEAEWEFAARGGNKSNHTQYAGGSDISSVAWYSDNSGGEFHPVAQKNPNELGLYDMSGNVWEWCQDWYDKNYYKNSPKKNPFNEIKASYRVVRGGSWDGYATCCRLAERGWRWPDLHYGDLGLRLAL